MRRSDSTMDRTRRGLALALLASILVAAGCAPAAPSPTAAPAKPTEAPKPAATAAPAKPAASPAAKPAEPKPAASPAAKTEVKPAASPAAKPAASPAAKASFDEKAVADFYRGKTLKIVVGLSAGGGFDLASRMLARHMPRFIPGSPNIIVENRPGAGSALATNQVYNTEPKDGTVIGNVDSSVVFRQALGQQGVEYDANKFQWLGATMKDATACLVRAETGVKSIQDSINGKEVVLGTLGLGNNSHDIPLVLNATLGSKLKLVPGYQGANNLRLAVDNKEIDGFCITFFTGFLVGDRQRLEGATPPANVFAIMGEKVPDHPLTRALPSVISLAKTEDDKQMLRAVDAPQLINKPYMLAPEVPRDRVEALRQALANTYKDPAFLDESKRANLDVDSSTADETARVVQQVLGTSPAVIAKFKEILK